jgi:hypothetical protein
MESTNAKRPLGQGAILSMHDLRKYAGILDDIPPFTAVV